MKWYTMQHLVFWNQELKVYELICLQWIQDEKPPNNFEYFKIRLFFFLSCCFYDFIGLEIVYFKQSNQKWHKTLNWYDDNWNFGPQQSAQSDFLQRPDARGRGWEWRGGRPAVSFLKGQVVVAGSARVVSVCDVVVLLWLSCWQSCTPSDSWMHQTIFAL